MATRTRRALAVMAIIAMMACELVPVLGPGDASSTNEDMVFDPDGDPIRWADPLDDLRHVYIPIGGLVGVEVSGGEVRLLPGCTSGWIASEAIACPIGFRYDLVVLDVNATGGSSVQLCVLDPSREPTQVGYANETVPGFDKTGAPERSVYAISPAAHPSVRIQVTLVANGTQAPRLLGWSLYFTALDEWRDEFAGALKRTDIRGLNITGGFATVDLTGKKSTGGGPGQYDPYPPAALPIYKTGGPDTMKVLMPKDTGDGYEDAVSVAVEGAYGVCFDDLDLDGDLDLVVANYYQGTTYPKSAIFWNDGSDTWSMSNSQELDVLHGFSATTGDFNADGYPDIVIGVSDMSGDPRTSVFLNDGQASFDDAPDSVISDDAYSMAVADFNVDGYPDIVLCHYTTEPVQAYFGGPNGLDGTADLTFECTWVKYDVCTGDMNGDGFLDFVLSTQGKILVYHGAEDGIDTSADAIINADSNEYFGRCRCGDVDGDGYDDIAVYNGGSSIDDLCVYRGSEIGVIISSPHTVALSGYVYRLQMADVDKDGFCDIALAMLSAFDVYFGGETLPTAPRISMPTGGSPNDLALAIPRHGGGSGKASYRGSFVTEAIALPSGDRWDVIHIDGTVPPNTTVEVTVLDAQGRPVAGYEGVPSLDIDLSGLGSTPVIELKVKLSTELNTTTPSLDRVIVKWLPMNAWRDEFYGPSKVAQAKGLWPFAGVLTLDPLANAVGIVYANMRGDAGYGVRSRATSLAEMDHPLESSRRPPVEFDTEGASAVATADVNGDGFTDVAFASYGATEDSRASVSRVFMGTPAGWRPNPLREFETTGASDVLLRDLNGDGRVDVVFAQERDDASYDVPSLLFWGRLEGGWNETPDVLFETMGATGVVAADLDGDGRMDLAFSCYKDALSTSTDSMAFLQGAAGFCGTAPDLRLPTMGARAVDAGDINGDGRMDLAFANSFSGGLCEIDSYVYLGKAAGGFGSQPVTLRTAGAEDVKLADIDGDGDVDATFANSRGNTGTRRVDSYLYLNRGAGSFPAAPDVRLPTTGASAVAVADLIPGGYRDLLFACEGNGSGYEVMSRAFLGYEGGMDTSGTLQLPTKGASDVVALDLTGYESLTGGYISRAITPEDPRETGGFDALRYSAAIDVPDLITLTLRVVDAVTWETLSEALMEDGQHELSLRGAFMFKEHPSVRLMVVLHSNATGGEGPVIADGLRVDQLWLNWTKRTHQPPSVLGLAPTTPSVLRLASVGIGIMASDEYDPVRELRVQVEHRPSGTTGWESALVGMPYLESGAWRLTFTPKATSPTGAYDLRVRVTDADGEQSPWAEFPSALMVRNNVPTAPEVRMDPGRPVTTSTLSAAIVRPASDVENSALTYRYAWSRDGVPMSGITGDTVNSALTSKGENWTVEIRAWDGEDAGPAATAWRVIQNAAPVAKKQLPTPEIDEDSTDDRWLDLSTAFEDPDGDPVAWSLGTLLQHLQVSIDPATGRVTIVPEADWNGRENVTFVASDGELQSSQVVGVIVRPVNDVPYYVSVDGKPISAQPIVCTIRQGQLLIIKVVALDVEGDALQFSVNSTIVEVDAAAGELRFQPDNDEVGTLRFCLKVWDTASPNVKAPLNFTVSIENVNDPMGDPRITNPRPGDRYKANATFTLIGVCSDPDLAYGQVLNYTWTSNVSGPLGWGSSLQVRLLAPGTHLIMLRVTDGEFEKTASVEVLIEPKDGDVIPPDPNGGGEDPGDHAGGLSYAWLILLVVVIVGAVGGAIVLSSKRRADAEEAIDETEAARPMDKQEALKHMVEALKTSADDLETDLRTNGNGHGHGNGHGNSNGQGKAAAAPDAPVATVERVNGIEVLRADMPAAQLSIEARVTEAASADVQDLWEDIGENGAASAESERDKEALRLDNLKRKYHNAIGRLPYGIPSAELRDRDWNELAAALAMGARRTLPDGREVASIGGRWYYCDPEDSSTFLKEHGERPKADAPRAKALPHADRAELLAKLEERFIVGEISEETYKELRRKYGG